METDTLNNLAAEMGHLYQECRHAFPYEDIRTLRQQTPKRWPDLIPDLDMYNSTVAGYCSWGRKAFGWSDGKLQEIRTSLAHTFWERHPEYLPLQDKINADTTPALDADMVLYEKMRQTILNFADCLAEHRAAQTLQGVA